MNDGSASVSLATTRISALTEHYQKTFELILHFWENRNRQFLMLTGLIAATALATIFQHPLLAAIEGFLKTNNFLDPDLVTALPLAYRVLVAFLLVAVFYLMATLYHRSGVIINGYQYLAVLERRIRRELYLGADEIAFSRESRFYQITGQRMSNWIGFSYKLILGSVTLLLFASRIWFDLPSEWPRSFRPQDAALWYGWLFGNFFFLMDVIIALPTLFLFWRYASLEGKPDAQVAEEFERLEHQAG